MFLYVYEQTFRKLYGRMTQKLLGLRMENFQQIVFIWIRKYRKIFKSALVYTLLGLFPNIEQKRTPLDDNIVWCKNFRVIKVIYQLRVNFTYFLKNVSHKKNPWNLKGFFVKISLLRILEVISYVKVSSFQIFYFAKFQS